MNSSSTSTAAARRHNLLAWAGVVAAVLCWSGNALVARAVHAEIPPLALAFWRWALALALLLPFTAPALWRHRAALRHAGWRLLALALPGITCFNTLLYVAAGTTDAVNITLVNTCLPLVAFIASGFLLGQWPGRTTWIGLAVAAGGLVYLISRGSLERLLGLDFHAGDLIMLLAISLWALYTVLLKRWHSHLQMPTLVLLSALILLGLPALAPAYLWELASVGGFEPNTHTLGAIAYTAVFASLLALFGWNHGVATLGAARASMTSYLMPVFTALLSWLLLEEPLRAYHLIGGGCIFAGLLLTSRPTPVPRQAT